MRAVQIIEAGKVALADVDMPKLKPGYVLLKVEYVGFCGSDLNTYRGFNPLVKLPVIPGHEIGARIEAVGEGVPEFFKPGMAATINPYSNCGHCSACRNSRPNACRDNETLGVQRNGAMCDYICMPWEKVIPDDSISTRDFALVEPMSVGFHAVNRAQITDLDYVMVIGCGMIGVGAIVRASLRGAKVIAVDVDNNKLELAKILGAKYTINSMTENMEQRVKEITAGEGVDVTIEAVGRPQTYVAAVMNTAFTGRIVYIGYSKQPVEFDTQYFVKKELDIRGSRNAMPTDFAAVIEYLKRGTCPVDKLITAIYTPEQAGEALQTWASAPGNVFRILVKF